MADFVGREQEIAELHHALTGGGAAAICGLKGMGGIGKTELALVVANALTEQFPDGQLVVELFGASNPVSAEAALQAAIRAFAPQAKLPDDLAALKQLYAACLHGKRVLILADDARDQAQVCPLLPPVGAQNAEDCSPHSYHTTAKKAGADYSYIPKEGFLCPVMCRPTRKNWNGLQRNSKNLISNSENA